MPKAKRDAMSGAIGLSLPRLRPDQWAIVQDPARIKVCAMGRRYGKSTMVGCTLTAAAASGNRCAIGAPNYRNTRPLWRWAENAVRPLVKSGLAVVNRSERTIEFPSVGGFLGVYSLDNPDSMRGEWFDLVAIDEAARVSEEAWTDVIQPCLADYAGQAFLISTPKGRNWFWREFIAGQEDGKYIKSWTAPSSDNPMPSIRAAVEKAKQRVSDNTFRQEWMAEFVEDAMTYFSPEWFEGNLNRYDPRIPRHANTCIARYMSWDTGYKDTEGNAYSACIVADLMPDYRLQVREVFRERLNFPNLIRKITDLAEHYSEDGKLRNILIEDRASGTSAYQTMVASGHPILSHIMTPFMPSGSKEQRAAQAGAWCENGSVLLPMPDQAVPWLYDFEDEIYSMPNTLYKDQADAFAQLILYLENILRAGLAARRTAFGETDYGLLGRNLAGRMY